MLSPIAVISFNEDTENIIYKIELMNKYINYNCYVLYAAADFEPLLCSRCSNSLDKFKSITKYNKVIYLKFECSFCKATTHGDNNILSLRSEMRIEVVETYLI